MWWYSGAFTRGFGVVGDDSVVLVEAGAGFSNVVGKLMVGLALSDLLSCLDLAASKGFLTSEATLKITSNLDASSAVGSE